MLGDPGVGMAGGRGGVDHGAAGDGRDQSVIGIKPSIHPSSSLPARHASNDDVVMHRSRSVDQAIDHKTFYFCSPSITSRVSSIIFDLLLNIKIYEKLARHTISVVGEN